MKTLIPKIGVVLVVLLLPISVPTQSTKNAASFAAELFDEIARDRINQNIVISPVSIRTCLALAFIGADGATANELRQGLHLGKSGVSEKQVAENFASLLNSMEGGNNMKMINRIYVSERHQIAREFNSAAQKYFNTSAENVDFSNNVETSGAINYWVQQQTQNKIQNLITTNDIDAATDVLLINAIFFKAEWWNTFDSNNTSQQYFHASKTSQKPVDMMYQERKFSYADLPKWDAKALSMRYVDTNIQMLIILPNQLDGLAQLERQLEGVDLIELLREQLLPTDVRLTLPKFKVQFNIPLKPTLESLGMRQLFRATTDFSRMLISSDKVGVSDVIHKAFIQINENGTEAVASTVIRFGPLSASYRTVVKDFNVDHPFFFALLDTETVYFVGHVADV